MRLFISSNCRNQRSSEDCEPDDLCCCTGGSLRRMRSCPKAKTAPAKLSPFAHPQIHTYKERPAWP